MSPLALLATGPERSKSARAVRTGSETLCGASKTPHRGQRRDSPAQETINWNGVNLIAGAGHKMNMRGSPRRRLGRRPCGKSYWP